MATETDAVFLDVMPADVDTDMHRLEECVCELKIPGLTWSGKFSVEDVAYGIKKLRVGCPPHRREV